MGEKINMKRMKLITLLVVISMLLAPMAHAQNPAKKLSRGFINMFTGWAELPRNIYDTTIEENLLVGITIGIIKGIGMAIVRTGAGVYEIITFPFPVPHDYVPVLEPEFVFSQE